MQVLKADFESKDGPQVFVKSLRETGFAVVKNHPIPRNLIDDVYSDWKNFFSSPSKFDYLYSKETQAGYFPFKSENAKGYPAKDLKEFYHVYDGEKFPNQLSSKTWTLKNELMKLGNHLLRWIDEGSPEEVRKSFSMPLDQMADGSPKNLFRIIHYPPIDSNEEVSAIRAAAHEDINLITLLPAATAMGLQVQDLEGQWFDVPGEYGDIVVNVGDMLQEASQGFYKSTTHQVINPEGDQTKTSRYSMPLFVHPFPEVKLSERYTAQTYLDERLRELGLK